MKPEMWIDGNPHPAQVAHLLGHEHLKNANFTSVITPEKILQAISRDDVGVVVCKVGDAAAGFIGVRWENEICAKIALGFLEPARGKAAAQFIRMFLDKLFKNTSVVKVVGEVATNNRACLRLAGLLGFKREGLNRQAAIVDGQVVDLVHIGLTRGDWNGLSLRN